jgi:hypothetical protein
MILKINYKNKEWKDRLSIIDDNDYSLLGYEIVTIIKQGATNININYE